MLLWDKGTWMWTTCLRLLHSSARLGVKLTSSHHLQVWHFSCCAIVSQVFIILQFLSKLIDYIMIRCIQFFFFFWGERHQLGLWPVSSGPMQFLGSRWRAIVFLILTLGVASGSHWGNSVPKTPWLGTLILGPKSAHVSVFKWSKIVVIKATQRFIMCEKTHFFTYTCPSWLEKSLV